MSFSSDRAALDCLCDLAFEQGFAIDVTFEEGEIIASSCTTRAAVFEAVSATADPVKLKLRRCGPLFGVFLVLLQDDPECLVADHSDNDVCNAIAALWSARAEATA